jgi:carbonyl reductase 1
MGLCAHLAMSAASTRLAVVTGANKGIGFKIAEKLCSGGFKVIVACRNEALGQKAAEDLKAFGQAEFRSLDISNEESIKSFAEGLGRDYTGLDVLINNAAIAFHNADPTPFTQQAAPTMLTNYFGTLHMTQALLPLLRKSASPRLVNVASMAGHLKILKSPQLKERFTSDLTIPELTQLVEQFVADVQGGVHAQKGWPNSNYGMSKLAVVAITKIFAAQEAQNPSMKINCCCPGWCATDMSSHSGPRSAEMGARTPVFLATLPDDAPSGGFFKDEMEVEW